jgi:hypothetical protein
VDKPKIRSVKTKDGKFLMVAKNDYSYNTLLKKSLEAKLIQTF